MLTHLSIHNFAIVEKLDLELSRGMTVVSGETGAGKSIMIDALQLALGGRADSGAVRSGAKKTEIIANFDISQLPQAQAWLDAQELSLDGECILRRIITLEGRSRSFINGRNCPLSSLRDLGQFLVAIHGQHEHQSLLQKEHHRLLLDNFAAHTSLQDKTTISFNQYQQLHRALVKLSSQSEEQQAKVQLLSYQVEELEQLSLADEEVESLELEQKNLSQASEILHSGQQLLDMLDEGEQQHAAQLLNQSMQVQAQLPQQNTEIAQAAELINSALIQVEEAASGIRQYLNKVEINPQRLLDVEERLSLIFNLARKHKVEPNQLVALHCQLSDELNVISGSDETIATLQSSVDQARDSFLNLAGRLSKQRHTAARKLNKQINIQLALLGMPAAEFAVSLTPYGPEQLNSYGLEEIEFIISTNKGQAPKPLAKIASGGELSRISLAIQVVTAQSNTTPTLMFDEVDVGIGGAIAEVVGKLLRQLGQNSQVLCITHQPQVASQGHQHLYVSKRTERNNTHTQVQIIDSETRINEIARMLGGVDITQRTLDHAREMLG
ncbi:MAG: DNA repair protein RecN [Pseudomonadales bacterium]|nr:DNA repair protein RecN [Pseudomonadales bacterium]NRA14978.1 DNA repair protein RecN [Oceanospirillaceae bacterium]